MAGYIDGYKQAQSDYAKGYPRLCPCKASQEYRNGYSDGYWKAEGGEKTW